MSIGFCAMDNRSRETSALKTDEPIFGSLGSELYTLSILSTLLVGQIVT